MSVAPNFSRMSNTGTPAAMKAALWNIACIGTPTSPNGTTDGEWLCTTDMMSGPRLVDLAVDEALEESCRGRWR